MLVVTEYAVTLIDVKGTHGRIEVTGGRWYPSNRQSFRSPVEKLRGHARALKGNLAPHGLSRIFVDSLVVLTAPDARLDRRQHRPGRRRPARGHRPRRPDPRAQQAGAGAAGFPPRHPPVPGPDHQGHHWRRRAADRAAAVRPLGGHRVARRDRGGHRVPRAERRRPGRVVRAAAGLPRRPVPAGGRARSGADRDHQRVRHAGQAAVARLRRRLPGLLPQRGREPVRPGPRGRQGQRAAAAPHRSAARPDHRREAAGDQGHAARTGARAREPGAAPGAVPDHRARHEHGRRRC